ncbi:hypothetical protein TNCV_55381 [Trichonephila clavipes]|nr:hypothetical protein TNCV_55381 [Trichonephila clavipes]
MACHELETNAAEDPPLVMVTDSEPPCHEFEPNSAKDCSRRGESMPVKRPPLGRVWKLGELVPAQVSSFSLDCGSK